MRLRKLLPVIAFILVIGTLVSCTVQSGINNTDETTSGIATESTTESTTESAVATESGSESDTEDETENNDKPNIEKNGKEPYYIIEAVASYGRNGLANGWKYDNRFDLANATGLDSNIVYDVSDEKFYRLIRDFESEDQGFFKLEMIIEARSNDEGVYIAMCGANDEKVFYLTPKNGVWVFVGENELVTEISIDNGAATQSFGIEMDIDLDNNTASVTINNVYCGSIVIPDKAIERLILGTNKVGMGTIGFSYVRFIKNYPIVDRFILPDVATFEGQPPASWTVSGDFKLDRIESMRLYDMYSVKADSTAGSVSNAKKSFRSISGNVSFETMILLPEKTDGASVSMLSGDEKIITFETRDGKIYVGDEMVNDYIPNIWQTLHVDADTNTGKAKIYVNGKHKTTVDFECEAFDGISVDFTPETDAVMWFDDVEVYEVIKYADYPEAPQVAESTEYNIGINVCWLWRDQQSGEGWDATSPFSEFDPYLGYYDEGVRETADWELKWLAEHGIDFMHVCWYAPSADQQNPIKEMRHSYSALHDGYMMAEYSDLVDFCIMWENSSVDCYSLEQFREYIWNYWCEYYFADSRYARLDNKAVITVWSRENFEKAFGGREGALAAMEWMKEDIKKYGYDGIVFLASAQGPWTDADYERLAAQGYDATYAYHWSARGEDDGYQIKCNKNNFDRALKAGVYHIPTISMGFNDVGRNETRDPIVTVKGHEKVCTNAKKLVDSQKTGTWKDNTIFLSTWNEYSEGTYMFPTESTGFDYLENVRRVFTKDKSDHTELDVRPTENQIYRITHLYPENHSPIRWYQFESADYDTMEYGVRINGTDMSFTFYPQPTDDGDYLVVGEAKGKGFYSMMRVFYEWDRYTDDGVLTLHSYTEHTYVFRVGSDKVTVDGVEQDLGFTFTLRDGLPQFHLKKLCDLLGYKYTVEGKVISVQACTDEEYAHLKDMTGNAWEFDIVGESQGWKVQQGSGFVALNGTLQVTPTGIDVAIIRNVDFYAYEYNVVKVGVKYNPIVMSGTATLYFTTTAATSFSGDRAVTVRYDVTGKSEGDTVEIVFRLEDCVNYRGKIAKIRIDPFTGTEPFEIDYVRCEYDESLLLENNVTEIEDENQWEFNTDGDKEGWTVGGTTSIDSVRDGLLKATAHVEDPHIVKTVNFRASKYQVLIVRMKFVEDMRTKSPTLYFTTTTGEKWDDSRSAKGTVRITADTEVGDIVAVVFNLTEYSSWKGTITGLRFDPFDEKGAFEIDSIKLYQKKGQEMTGKPATKPTEAVITDVENLPEGIVVQAHNGKIVIVEDPAEAGNKVFKVECTNSTGDGKVYTYFNLFMQFEPGETYNVTYKIMPLTDINGDAFGNTILGGNLRYGTVSAAFKDHTFDGGENKASSDEWIEVTVTVKIPANYSASDNDCFQIWGKFSHESGLGINYLVKDISITLAN